MGRTEISVKDLDEGDDIHCRIYINDQEMNEKAETTSYIFDYIKNFIKKPIEVLIKHYFDLPVGCGYGASGSGALGTIYGLNHILNLGIDDKEKGIVPLGRNPIIEQLVTCV